MSLPILLVDDSPKNLSYILSHLHDDVAPIIVDIEEKNPNNKNMNLNSVMMAAAMAGVVSKGKPWDMPAFGSINFNLRRDNDREALESANRKIELAREENRKKKLDRAANKV